MDRYRDRRSPNRPPYGRGAPPGDSYVPGGRGPRPRSRSPPPYRRRSRSPPPRMNDRWTPRGRSPMGGRFDPPPRDYYPPRDPRPRSPRRDFDGPPGDRYYPPARSPPPHAMKRSREVSPANGRPRSPMNKNRRIGSPPPRDYGRPRSPPGRRPYSPPPRDRGFRPYSRSPPPPRREERSAPYTGPNVWRRRSPSPRSSGHDSAPLSRRSSPRPFDRRPPDAGGSFRSPHPRSPYIPDRDRDRPGPPPARDSEDHNAAPPAPPPRDYPVPPRDRDRASDSTEPRDRPHAPPSGPAHQPSAPAALSTPSGPRYPTAASPTGPSPRPPSAAHGGPGGPPTGPSRGGGSTSNTPFRGRGGYDFPRRGSHTWTAAPPSGPSGRGRGSDTSSSTPRGPAHDSYDARPPGPRARDSFPNAAGSAQSPPFPPSFRGNASSSRTYPMTRRFNVDAALAAVPPLKPHGEPLPPLVDNAKAARLEDEAARLRKLIDEKRAAGRAALREWDALARDSAVAADRSRVVDEEMRAVCGESVGGAAF